MGGNRATNALTRMRWCYRVDETPAGCADQKWQIEVLECGTPADAGNPLFGGLATADPGVEYYDIARDARARCNFQRAGKESGYVGNDVDRSVGSITVVHHDHGYAASSDQRRHIGITLQAPHVVDDAYALVDRPSCNCCFYRVDRHRHAQFDCRGQNRPQPRLFIIRRHWNCATIGTRRFSTDIENSGTSVSHVRGR